MYSKLVGDYDDDHTPILRSIYSPDELVCCPYDDSTTLYHALQRGLRRFPNNPLYGFRQLTENGYGEYQYITYQEFDIRFRNFGSGILKLNLINKIDDLSLFGVFCCNCVEWVICEHATNGYGITLVPLHERSPLSDLETMINSTELMSLLCTPNEIKLLMEMNTIYLKNIILTQKVDEPSFASLSQKYNVLYMDEVERVGEINLYPCKPPNPDDICTICFTSGTTGVSKGVMVTHRSFLANVAGWRKMGLIYTEQDVYLSYLPLSHIMERVVHVAIYEEGGKIGFYSDINLIFDDLKHLKPTIFAAVPRIYTKIYEVTRKLILSSHTNDELDLFIEEKADLFPQGIYKHERDDEFFTNIVKEMGLDQVRWSQTGGAPLEVDVMNYIRALLSSPLIEGYGLTETISITFTSPKDLSYNCIGGPIASTEVRLESAPLLGYFVTDRTHNDIPCLGRGEICCRGPGLCKGYFRDKILFESKVDADGWFHTGDVAILLPNHGLKIIDRMNNIVKLAQGEFIQPEYLSRVFKQIDKDIIEFIIYSETTWLYPVALVVSEKLTDKNELLSRITSYGKQSPDIRGFEIPKDILLTNELFTQENKMLTSSGKISKKDVLRKYSNQLRDLYQNCLYK